MLNKNFKKSLAVLLCSVMATVAVPANFVKAEAQETPATCAECSEYKVTEADIFPGNDKTDWASARTLADTDDGLQITQNLDGNNLAYRHYIDKRVSVDGAHMKLTVHSVNTENPKDARITLYIADDLNNVHKGIALRLYVRESYLRVDINDSEQDVQYIPDVFSKAVSTLEIKTTVTSDNDVVFVINDYEYVVSNELWTSATGLSDLTNVYFLVGPREGKLDYTWNYFHGKDAVCYDEIAAVENLIATMMLNKTSDNVVAARKAYLTLSEEEKAQVENKEALKFENEDSSFWQDAKIHLMTESRISPDSTKTAWASARTITETADGLRIAQMVDGNNLAYRHNTNKKVDVNGAHMKLTVHSTDTSNPKDARITLYIADSLDLAHKGIALRLYVRESYLRLDINDSEQDIQYIPDVFSKTVATLEIETSVTSAGDVVVVINGYEYEISSELLASATGLTDLTKAYFLIGPREGKLDYTWHYFHGGDEVCWPKVCEVETKIDLCNHINPIKGNVVAAREAYDALNETEQVIVMNTAQLTAAEANAKDTDFYHYGLTLPKVGCSDSWNIVHKQVSDGYNIDYSQGASGMGKVYRFRFEEAITLNGAHIGATLPVDGTNSKFFLSLSNTNDNASVDEDLCLKIDLRGGANFLYADGAANVDTSGLFGYNGANNDRIKFPSIGTNELDIRFYVASDKSLYITVNGYYIKVTQEQLAGLEDFDVDQPIYVGVSPDGGTKPNITVNYIVSGDNNSYDELTGDVNNDTTTNLLDFMRMKKYEAATDKNTVLVSYYRSASDLDENGTTGDTDDLAQLKQVLVGAE